MNEIRNLKIDLPDVHLDYIPKTDYGAETSRLENERLWPRVWQVACREENLSSRAAAGC